MPSVPHSRDHKVNHYVLKISGTSHEYNHHLPIESSEDFHYEVALLQATIPKSWHTISPALNNDTLTINGVAVTIEAGHHSVDTVETFIRDYITTAHSQALSDEFDIIRVEYLGRCRVKAPTGIPINLGTLGPVLGFPANTAIAGAATATGTSTVNLTAGIEEIEIHCNLVDRKFTKSNSRNAGLIGVIPPPAHPPYSRFNAVIEPFYVPMTYTTDIRSVQFEILDQDGAPIDLQGERPEFLVAIQKTNK